MLHKIKLTLISLGILPAILLSSAVALAFNPLDQACQKTPESPTCKSAQDQNASGTDPIAGKGGVINKAANIVALVTVIAAIIMMLLGAFFYVTANGNSENAAKAKARILSALIGLVIIASAWALVRLVTDKLIE
jgi:hypothetical protein